MRNATDAVGVVLKELKTQSALGLFHLLVAVDGVNALWGRTTLKREDRTLVGMFVFSDSVWDKTLGSPLWGPEKVLDYMETEQ